MGTLADFCTLSAPQDAARGDEEEPAFRKQSELKILVGCRWLLWAFQLNPKSFCCIHTFTALCDCNTAVREHWFSHLLCEEEKDIEIIHLPLSIRGLLKGELWSKTRYCSVIDNRSTVYVT